MTEASDASAAPRADATLAALLLTNRLATLAAKPYTASEFWTLVEACARLDELLTADVATIADAAGVDQAEALRIRTLLDASRAFAFERERLEDGGIALVSAIDPTFPASLRARLGTSCPPFLLVAGPLEWLSASDALGIAGSPAAPDGAALAVVRDAAGAAADRDWSVITGLATEIDRAAIDTASARGGRCVGVPAEGINVVSRRSEVRRRVHGRQLCLVSPYAPNARSSAAAAMGRQKIIHAMSSVTVVIGDDKNSGAAETLERGWCPLAVWTGAGAGDGNAALIKRGAHPIDRVDQLFQPLTPTTPAEPPPALF